MVKITLFKWNLNLLIIYYFQVMEVIKQICFSLRGNLGSQIHCVTEGDVKVKRRGPCRSVPITVSKPPGVRRRPGRPRLQDKRWPGISGRTAHYRKSMQFPSNNSERLKRATRRSSMLRATVSHWCRKYTIHATQTMFIWSTQDKWQLLFSFVKICY